MVLKKTLKDQINIYNTLLELSEKKTDIIVRNNIKELDNLTKEEQEIIIDLSQCEKNRQKAVNTIASIMEVKEDINMIAIYDHLNDHDKKEIEEIRDELLNIIEKLNDRNKLNESLIKDSLEYIDLNLELLTTDGFENTYSDKDNGQVNKKQKSLFDFKA